MHAIGIIDLTFGDAGKGTMVDAAVRKLGADWVVRFNGGAQAAHNVITAEGLHHTFSQFGSGTFAGARTYLAESVLVNPHLMLLEAKSLSGKGVATPLHRMFVDAECRITTPWHIALNRLREIARGTNRHGSCGLGVGETMQDYITNPNAILRAKDCLVPGVLQGKLRGILTRLQSELQLLSLPKTDEVQNYLSWFDKPQLLITYDDISLWARCVHIVTTPPILSSTSSVIWEGAQGVLLDEYVGFHPFTTWSTTTGSNIVEFCKKYKMEVPTFYGVMRTYMTRHGVGPMPSEGVNYNTELHNQYNSWQTAFRQGYLDVPLLKYALRSCGNISGLMLTHTDVQIDGIVSSYAQNSLTIPQSIPEQEANTLHLSTVRPIVTPMTTAKLSNYLTQELNLPIVGMSFGPKSDDKQFTL